ATGWLRLAGDRRGDDHRALRHHIPPDARSARHGSDQCAARAQPATRSTVALHARGGNLCRPVFRSGRAYKGDVSDRLVLGLGPARIAAEAPEAGQRRSVALEDTRERAAAVVYQFKPSTM